MSVTIEIPAFAIDAWRDQAGKIDRWKVVGEGGEKPLRVERSPAVGGEAISALADGHGSGPFQVEGRSRAVLAGLMADLLHARVQRLLFEEMSEFTDLATVERALNEIRELTSRHEDLRAAA